jgi:threonylcarbamoyladenosine tRNA methylthiotransferase MtaB
VSLEVLTFGCRLNISESEVMRAHAQSAGLENAILINTCTVTGEAERQARQAIRRARREHPGAKVIVTGCATQVHREAFAAMPEIDVILDNNEKLNPESFRKISGTNRDITVPPARGRGGEGQEHTRAFVQVQNGCNHRCTFCIIPYGRGDSRSVPMGEVVRQVREKLEEGYKEVVFTGVDLCAYGEDLPATPTLGALVRRVLRAVPELPRLRLSSIDAAEIDPALWEAIAEEERLMPHLHLSIQSGDDLILKRMKRRHTRADILAFAARARALRPGIVLGADFITGFPTETEAMFSRTLDLVEEAELTWLHVFPYSARTGTPAARMPQVPVPTRKERAARLRKAGARREAMFLHSCVGREAQVLMEKSGIGHTERFAPVRFSEEFLAGTLASACVTGVEDGTLLAQAL